MTLSFQRNVQKQCLLTLAYCEDNSSQLSLLLLTIKKVIDGTLIIDNKIMAKCVESDCATYFKKCNR